MNNAEIVAAYILEKTIANKYGLDIEVGEGNFYVFVKKAYEEYEFHLQYKTIEEVSAFTEGYIRAKGMVHEGSNSLS